jgi:hypothetical protein
MNTGVDLIIRLLTRTSYYVCFNLLFIIRDYKQVFGKNKTAGTLKCTNVIENQAERTREMSHVAFSLIHLQPYFLLQFFSCAVSSLCELKLLPHFGHLN